jgi:hypothetical protein
MTAPTQGTEGVNRLARALARLSARLEALELRLDQGKELWPAYLATLNTWLAVMAQASPGARGELLTTRAMAARLNVAPKTLLKWKAAGKVRPAQQLGQRGRAAIRWKGDEAAR